MPSEKFFVHKEDGSLVRLKGRLVRFLDEEPPTGSDKSAIRTALEVSPDAEGLVQADIGTDPNQLVLHQHLGTLAYQSADSVAMGTAEAESLTVDSGGSTQPTQSVVTNAGAEGSALELRNNSITSSTATALTFTNSTAAGSNYGAAKISAVRTDSGFSGNTDISISSSTSGSVTEKVRIDTSGNVTVASGDVTATSGQFNSGASNASGPAFAVSTGNGIYNSGANQIGFSTNSTKRWTIDSSGNLVANGTAIDFGAVASGTGTVVPTTGGTLDDFERGSFTPSFTSTGTAPTLTYLAQVGTYTKVGNLVTCHGRVRVNAVTGAGTGSLQISGLPFATQNVSNLGSGGSVCLAAFFGTSSSGCPTHISGGNNASVMTLKTLKNSAGVVASLDNTDAADLAGSCYVDFSITYTTA